MGRPQGPELVEGEDPVREVLRDVLDAVELGGAGGGRLDDEDLVVRGEQSVSCAK